MTYQQHITVEYDGPAGGLQAGDMLDGYGFEFKVIGYSAPVAMRTTTTFIVQITDDDECTWVSQDIVNAMIESYRRIIESRGVTVEVTPQP